MEDLDKVFKLLGILVIGLGTGLIINSSFQQPVDQDTGENDDWKNITVQDVQSGENFTISGLEKPVLIETFAVWCTTCSRQQSEIKDLHGEIEFRSVSLNVDTKEDAEKIREHMRENNFTWSYAISPIKLTNSLRQNFANSIANPSSAPVILVCEDGARRIEKDGIGSPVKSSQMLKEEIKLGCDGTAATDRSGSGAVAG